MEQTFEFTSSVSSEWREAVEQLFFFNPRQTVHLELIKETVDQTGVLRIAERDARVWIEASTGAMQCLFVCRRAEPLGVALYCRPSPEVIWIAHLAVHPAHGLKDHGSPGLGIQLTNKVSEIARRIGGVRKIRLPYRRETYLSIR